MTQTLPPRILVVDDEPNLAELLTAALRYEGWATTTALTGQDAIRSAIDEAPDAVVLDVMLPDVDGLGALRRIRAHRPGVPMLFLTARDAVEDRVAGLTAGGDDYVTKPFSLEELVARLRGLLSVADDGPGIAPDQLPGLFQRFSRGDTARTRTGGSTGLGLAIAEAIVHAHGGTIAVAGATAGEAGATGATFTVRLPAVPTAAPARHSPARAGSPTVAA